jgi:hypothetical protein
MTKLQLAKWDGTGSIHTHRDTMVDIRAPPGPVSNETEAPSFWQIMGVPVRVEWTKKSPQTLVPPNIQYPNDLNIIGAFCIW